MGVKRGHVALATLALLAAACGARVNESQVRAAASTQGRAATVDATTSDTSTDARPIGPGEATATTQAPTVRQQTTGAAGPAAASSGDNGGATDVGVTATSITLGNVSTLSGPVPGLFEGAVVGAQAAIAYQNSLGGIFGRKLKLDARDDQFDTGQNRAETTDEIGKVFAFLNSFSLFDDAAVEAMQRANIPDFSVPINSSRARMPNNLSVAPIDATGGPTGSFEWLQEKFPDAIHNVGTIWGDVSGGRDQQTRMVKVAQALGWKFVYSRGYQPTETDFTADVIRMRQAGVKAVWLFDADDKTEGRLANAMKQQGFKPEFVASNYDPHIPSYAPGAAEGWYGIASQTLFASAEEAAINPEVKLFQQWVQKVKPGYHPDLYSIYGWSAGKLMFQAMQLAGPKLTRQGLIDAVRRIGQYSGNDTVAPANPGAKVPATCFIIAQVSNNEYHRVDPARGFDCRGHYLHT